MESDIHTSPFPAQLLNASRLMVKLCVLHALNERRSVPALLYSRGRNVWFSESIAFDPVAVGSYKGHIGTNHMYDVESTTKILKNSVKSPSNGFFPKLHDITPLSDTGIKVSNRTSAMWQVATKKYIKIFLIKWFFRFHNVFRRVLWHHNFLSDPGPSRMEHKRFSKERAQPGKALPGLRIWGA